ncbi:hypothetical protein F5890DRAFT_1421504, partial [Lentinula detonsa]
SSARRHLASAHRSMYEKFCKDNRFASMLPSDRKDALENKLSQSSLDDVVVKLDCKIPAVPYTEENFARAAFEWLVATDQPLWALQNKTFHKMIEIASRASSGVKIPSCKLTRQGIMDMFWEIMRSLKNRLHVCWPFSCDIYAIFTHLLVHPCYRPDILHLRRLAGQ